MKPTNNFLLILMLTNRDLELLQDCFKFIVQYIVFEQGLVVLSDKHQSHRNIQEHRSIFMSK